MEFETDHQWVVQINEKLKNHESSSMEIQKWKKHCIYETPPSVADLNKKAYNPLTVSFGPYHHMKKHLLAMEEHKHRALVHFLRRCNGKPLELLIQSMAEVEEDLRDCYKPLDDQWKSKNENNHSFLRMMILDGCFMLEVLRFAACYHAAGDYADNDPIFSCHGRLYVTPYIKRDMLMLENQIPMMVLDKLVEFEGNKNQDPEFLNKLILKFFCPDTPIFKSFGKCLHILDLYRKSLFQHEPTHPTIIPNQSKSNKHQEDEIIIPSARELLDAGITFKPSESHSFKDVSFNGGILRIPSIIVDDCTETMLLNLIAFERMHVGAGNEVSSFVFFMDNIIDNHVDVVILEQKGIVQNALGSDKAVAKLFNSLSRDLAVDRGGSLEIVQVSVCRYCKKPWNKWRANLIETYFRNPWAIVSFVAAIFLFGLTIVQTVYTILQLYHNT
ncbi:UPF0481 protein At3g47200-like [Prosopis cineraria]|uniref:UPF0481 protein At3g47200-like n=1 Tax=Prosopis cineraria TaxID=364024 RepID=UPI0024104126|nr:UPF0481 protein At3g47200-like [Prosopis cineraria]